MTETASMNPLARWSFALKPASWPKLIVPSIFGQALAINYTGHVEWASVGFGVAYTFFLLATIVLLNDWGDRKIDRLKREQFPDAGSRKTIPDGVLSARSVMIAGLVAALATIAVCWLGRFHPQKLMFLLPMGMINLLLFFAYTFPPLKLNYRGGGELLEMIGVGLALPAVHYYLQGNAPPGYGIEAVLAGFACLALCSAIASGLSDEESDRAGGKRTVVTRCGNPASRRIILVFLLIAVACWLAGFWTGDLYPNGLHLLGAGLLLVTSIPVFLKSKTAVTGAYAAQRKFKNSLHLAIWIPTLVFSVGLIVLSLF
jgi:1,4-dihydroxy-2-naphthoate octaprenyltransferase